MNKTLTIIATLGAASLIASIATAEPKGKGQSTERKAWAAERFKQLDTNKDGKLSKAELRAQRQSKLKAADKNGDGVLSQDEMKAAHEARRTEHQAKFFNRLDKNGDGKIVKSEVPRMPAERFAKLDANGDGQITATEMANAKPGPRGGKHAAKPRKAGKAAQGGFMKRLDANNDGKVTVDEALNASDRHFDRMDKNRDGAVTLEEFSRRGHPRHHKGRDGKGKGQDHGKRGERAQRGQARFS